MKKKLETKDAAEYTPDVKTGQWVTLGRHTTHKIRQENGRLCYTSHMDQHRSYQLWIKEQETMKELKAARPELFEYAGAFTHHDILQFIGITSIPPNLPDGYIRFRPEDFIVEEIDPQQHVHTIDLSSTTPVQQEDQRTLFCDMIKIGIATPAALDRVANAFHLEPRFIGSAGLKDAGAITCQRISIRGVTIEQAQATAIESIVLKNFSYGSGAIAPGQLGGNRFTLTIRTASPYNQQLLDEQVRELSKGVMNFYGTQRFGHRFLAHHFGRLLFQGHYETVVSDFLTSTNATERRFRSEIRGRVKACYGQWDEAEKIFAELPYTFQNELRAVRFLKDHPTDWIGAMMAIQDQTRMWIYSYTSWLTNMLLSTYALKKQPPPATIPIPMSPVATDMEPYRQWLEQDTIPNDFLQKLRPFAFLRPGSRQLQSVIVPNFHTAIAHDLGALLSFDLRPGAYATTVLINLFTLHSGQPAPSWVKDLPIDAPKILGTGSVDELRTTYEKFFMKKTVSEVELEA